MLQVKPVHAYFKLQKNSDFDVENESSLFLSPLIAARNSFQAFQLLFQKSTDFLLLTTRENQLHWSGHIPRVRVDVNAPGGIRVTPLIEGLIQDDDKNNRADPLLRNDNTIVRAGETQAVWLRLFVPETCPAGIHKITVRIFQQQGFEDEIPVIEIPVEINVSPTKLPAPADWSFYLDLWQHPAAVARWHQVALWSDRHFELLSQYLDSLAALGQKAITVIAGEIPWSGQRCFKDIPYASNLFEHSMIRLSKTTAGNWELDTSVMDRYIEMAMNRGIRDEIEVFGLLNIWQEAEWGFGKVIPEGLDGWRIRYFDETTQSMKYIRNLDDLGLYLQLIHGHFIKKGWLEKVRIAADEPSSDSNFSERLRFVQKFAPDFKYKVACNSFDMFEDVDPAVVDWTPNLEITAKDPELLKKVLDQATGRICYYVCCGPRQPNTFLRSPLAESHLLPWLAELFGVDGFLRWAFHLWPRDPWQQLTFRPEGWPAGDMGFT
ncbi:DUF4091 domain-containing protein, partial [bacterium]|nr:DUF4091 domain-containing protein [bacterium]